jgi:oligosaccharide repeat unit polymerase
MNKQYMYKALQSILFFLGILTMGLGLIFSEVLFVYLAALFFVISNIFFAIKKIHNRIIFLVFQFTFTLFLLVRPFILLLEKNLYYRFDEKIIWNSAIITLISIFSMALIVMIPIKWDTRNSTNSTKSKKSNYQNIRNASKYLFFITFIPLILVIIEKIIFAQTHTITEYYDSFISSMPLFITKLAESNMIIFYVFLGTFPAKKESRILVFFHIFASIMTLGYGVRNIIVLNLLVLIIYTVLRNKIIINKEHNIKKKSLVKILLLTPFAILILQTLDNIRRGRSVSSANLFRDFLFSQGSSAETISYSLYYANEIPDQSVPYSIGSIYNYITQNVLTRFIFGNPFYAQNTKEMALYGHHLGSTIAYLDYPITYLQGVGMGSSFLAELYYDFSVIGVILGTVILTVFLLKLINIIWKKPLVFGVGLVMIRWIIYTPRDTYTNWIVQGLSIMNLLAILAIYILSISIKTKNMTSG